MRKGLRLISPEDQEVIAAVCHNHPSGNLSPSKADEILTRSINRACEVMNITFLDHVIVTDGQYYSFHEQGKC
jgi:DNA repair protein RadC